MIVTFDPNTEVLAVHWSTYTAWYAAEHPPTRPGDQWNPVSVGLLQQVRVAPGAQVECLPYRAQVDA